MEEVKSQRGSGTTEADFVLQWGERKRVRCMKVKKDQNHTNGKSSDCLTKRKLMSRAVSSERGSPSRHLNRPNKITDSLVNVRRSCMASPEKEDRYYTTRGSMGIDESGKIIKEPVKETKKHVWPKLFVTLSNKEKEEDFLAMKGCKLPQRPKKRAKLVQKTLLASPLSFVFFITPFIMIANLGGMFYAAGESRCVVIRSVQREI